MSRRFDAIVVGAGQAGPSMAGRLSAAGLSVAVVERKLFGGTCVNTGCTPTKAMVASAYAAHLARRGADFGVSTGPVAVDMKAVKARRDRITADVRGGLEGWVRGLPGCTVLEGHARFESPTAIRVGDEVLEAERIFLNVGGRAFVPDMPGIGSVKTLTNSAMLELDTLPEHLAVVGGSYIGLEFAQMFRRFGSRVTVVEKGPRLVGREDPDVSDAIREILEAEGITVRLDAECISFRPRGDAIGVGVSCREGPPEVVGSHVLLAVGRVPNTDDLGLDRAGVETDARGYVKVDEQLRSSVPHIWALGDCNGRGAFTHTAYNDFEIAAANLFDGDARRVSDRIPTYGLFIDPPLGRVGMTEAEVRRAGRPALVGTRPMANIKRAIEKGETRGFIKILADAETGQILGASILGPGGDEAVHTITAAMAAKAPYTVLQRAVPIHPTVAELIPTVLSELRPLK